MPVNVFLISIDPPSGTQWSYNGLRLALSGASAMTLRFGCSCQTMERKSAWPTT